jgi:hypothetical protein
VPSDVHSLAEVKPPDCSPRTGTRHFSARSKPPRIQEGERQEIHEGPELMAVSTPYRTWTAASRRSKEIVLDVVVDEAGVVGNSTRGVSGIAASPPPSASQVSVMKRGRQRLPPRPTSSRPARSGSGPSPRGAS